MEKKSENTVDVTMLTPLSFFFFIELFVHGVIDETHKQNSNVVSKDYVMEFMEIIW